jgi:uncharacterized membrane protein
MAVESEPRFNLKPVLMASALMLAIMLILTAVAWIKIPDGQLIASHSNWKGQVDGYSSKPTALLGLPATTLLMAGLFALIAKVEPRRRNIKQSRRALAAIWVSLMAFFLVLQGLTVLNALGLKLEGNAVIYAVSGLIFVVVGNYLPKLRSNHFAGIRTPWTLSSELSWSKTHRLGGKLLILYGLVILVCSFFLNAIALFALFSGAGLALALFLAVYSYAVWKCDPDQIPADGDVALCGTSTAKRVIIGGALISVLLAAAIACVALKFQSPEEGAPSAREIVQSGKAARAFVNMLAKGDFKTAVDAYFDSTMRRAMPADKLQQAWSAHEQATGGLLKIDGVRHDTKGMFDLEYVACKSAHGVSDVEVVFNGSHQISGLWFVPHMEKPTVGSPSASIKNSEAAKVFVGMLASKDFKKAVDTYFDSIMRGALPADKLQQTWMTLTEQTGKFLKIDGVRSDNSAGFDIEYVVCHFSNATMDVKVVFNGSNQISGLWIVPHAG